MDKKEILEKRNKLITEERTLIDLAEKENRDFTAEENEASEARAEEISGLQKRLSRIQKQEEMEAEARALMEHSGSPEKEQEKAKPSFEARMNAFARKGGEYGELNEEARAANELFRDGKSIDIVRRTGMYDPERRATDNLAKGTDASGGYTVAEGFVPRLEEALYWTGSVRSLAEVLITNKGEDLPWPTVNDGASGTSNDGQLLAEEGAIAQHDPEMTFGQTVLNAYKYSSDLVKISSELLQDSEFDMAPVIADLLGKRLARALNAAFTTGTGSSQPQGVVTGSTLGVTAAATGAVTADEIMDLKFSVDRNYRVNGTFMMNDATAKAARQLKDSEGRYLLTLSNNADELDTLFSSPLAINDDMATMAANAKSILFGDFSKYKVREVQGIRLVRMDELYAANDLVGFIAFMRADGKLLNAGTNPIKHLVQAAS